MPVLSFGKYAGSRLEDVPEDYIVWLIGTRRKDLAEYEGELARRKACEEASASMVEKVVAEGYRALAKRLHPDAGGDPGQFRELVGAAEQLKAIVAELKAGGGGQT